jgi:hypothetical protein
MRCVVFEIGLAWDNDIVHAWLQKTAN